MRNDTETDLSKRTLSNDFKEIEIIDCKDLVLDVKVVIMFEPDLVYRTHEFAMIQCQR
jgi:hypothetical protein